MSKIPVYLVNTNFADIDAPPGDRVLGLKTIEAALDPEKYDVTLLPEKRVLAPNFIYKIPDLTDEFCVVGISTNTIDFVSATIFANAVRSRYPNAYIVSGGAHYACKDANEHALDFFDAVAVGHADGFVKFMDHIHSGKIKIDKTEKGFIVNGPIPDGMRVKTEEGIKGKGKGHYPIIDGPAPFIVRDYDLLDKPEVELYFQSECDNWCGFCSTDRRPLGIKIEDAVAGILKAEEENPDIKSFYLYDSNPFSRSTIDNTVMLLESLKKAGSKLKPKLYLDPSAVSIWPGKKTIFDILKKYNVHKVFMGRDAVNLKDDNDFIDSRFEGKIKDQEMLDADQKAIVDVIQLFDKLKKDEEPDMNVIISYIFHNKMTYVSAKSKLYDAQYFGSLSPRVQFLFNFFEPLPGTKFWQRGDFFPTHAARTDNFNFYGTDGIGHSIDYMVPVKNLSVALIPSPVFSLCHLAIDLGEGKFDEDTIPSMIANLDDEDYKKRMRKLNGRIKKEKLWHRHVHKKAAFQDALIDIFCDNKILKKVYARRFKALYHNNLKNREELSRIIRKME